MSANNAINNATVDLVKKWEGFASPASADPVGIPTLGYGHTSAQGLPTVCIGDIITEEQARELMMNDLRYCGAGVSRMVRVPLNDNQYGALSSFVFNLGPHNLQQSTLLRRLNAGDYNVANEFGKWVYAGGNVLPGLIKRRADEAKLWGTPQE